MYLFDNKLFPSGKQALEYWHDLYEDELFTINLHWMHGVGVRLKVWMRNETN
jgi:predicted membrane protein